MNLKFLTSAVDKAGYPTSRLPEVAVVGRSNAGKSSLLNAMSRKKVAKVSQTPGKTQLLNFFSAKDFILVDMPGYGFAQRSGKDVRAWQEMIEGYLLNRKNLRALLLVMDVRRDWSPDEQQLVDWIAQRELPVYVILNKSDKLSRNQLLGRQRIISKAAQGVADFFSLSSIKGDGVKEFTKSLTEIITQC